ncbi:hypothetical protein [Parachitinimonas caeni]|uniref:Uncharacterized protein n=1 Tax=Parachitinimonas caeni TaxID=3031301 RepID=A0ABT7DXF6_9NEIS|nr:hypothetical protein [Parachitinimonas caeni]MDK2123850.1 hypothetical protein [Parachitinimonas caeni]
MLMFLHEYTTRLAALPLQGLDYLDLPEVMNQVQHGTLGPSID